MHQNYFLIYQQQLVSTLAMSQNITDCKVHLGGGGWRLYCSKFPWTTPLPSFCLFDPFCNSKQMKYLHIRQSSQGTEECHGLATARGTTEYHWLVLCKPGVQECLVSHSVYCWYYNVWCRYFVCFHFNLRDLGLPQDPLALNCNLERKQTWVITTREEFL